VRDWALPLLRCLACGAAAPETGGVLDRDGDALRCRHCGASFPVHDGVANCLFDLHEVPERERSAVSGEDRRHWVAPTPGPAGADVAAAEAAYRQRVAEARTIVEELIEREPLPTRPLVVEVGADFGWTSALLVERGARVVATEISDHLLHAPAAAAADLCRIQADMNRLPLADGVADVVWASACVHHSWDLDRTFREIARVLRPGGRAYLCNEPLPAWPRWLLGFGFGREERELGINETWKRRGAWLAACRRAGLEPRLVFPSMRGERLARRLEHRRIPRFVAPLLAPLLPWLAVSIHLIADKPAR
jgi:SAM-dependent methyltransferase